MNRLVFYGALRDSRGGIVMVYNSANGGWLLVAIWFRHLGSAFAPKGLDGVILVGI